MNANPTAPRPRYLRSGCPSLGQSLALYLMLQVFHAVDHFFRGDLADESGYSSDLLADGAALVGQHDDAAVVDAFLEMLAMQTSEVAHVEGVNGSTLLDRKCELVPIGCPALICLDGGQDIDAASAESLNDGVLTGIFVHIEPLIARRPEACFRRSTHRTGHRRPPAPIRSRHGWRDSKPRQHTPGPATGGSTSGQCLRRSAPVCTEWRCDGP